MGVLVDITEETCTQLNMITGFKTLCILLACLFPLKIYMILLQTKHDTYPHSFYSNSKEALLGVSYERKVSKCETGWPADTATPSRQAILAQIYSLLSFMRGSLSANNIN